MFEFIGGVAAGMLFMIWIIVLIAEWRTPEERDGRDS